MFIHVRWIQRAVDVSSSTSSCWLLLASPGWKVSPLSPHDSNMPHYSQDGKSTRFNLKFFCNRRHSLNFDWMQHHIILFLESELSASTPQQLWICIQRTAHTALTPQCAKFEKVLFVWRRLELSQTSKLLGFGGFFFNLSNTFVIGLTLILLSRPSLQNNLMPAPELILL